MGGHLEGRDLHDHVRQFGHLQQVGELLTHHPGTTRRPHQHRLVQQHPELGRVASVQQLLSPEPQFDAPPGDLLRLDGDARSARPRRRSRLSAAAPERSGPRRSGWTRLPLPDRPGARTSPAARRRSSATSRAVRPCAPGRRTRPSCRDRSRRRGRGDRLRRVSLHGECPVSIRLIFAVEHRIRSAATSGVMPASPRIRRSCAPRTRRSAVGLDPAAGASVDFRDGWSGSMPGMRTPEDGRL